MTTATAQAHPNIAFIKYWGNRDERLRLPSNGSISMNLAGLETRTDLGSVGRAFRGNAKGEIVMDDMNDIQFDQKAPEPSPALKKLEKLVGTWDAYIAVKV